MYAMTWNDYRFYVALRWSDLESLKVRDEPLKIHFHQLRKRREWPTCAVYDFDSERSKRTDGNGSENFHRFHQRKEFAADVNSSSAQGPEISRKRYGKSRNPVEFSEVVDCVEFNDGDTLENRVVDDLYSAAETVPSSSYDREFRERYHSDPKISRATARGLKNDEYIAGKLKYLRSVKKSLLARMPHMTSGEQVKLKESVSNIDAGIAKLASQRSHAEYGPKDDLGGTRVPPPEPPDHLRHCRCDVCSVCSLCVRQYSTVACHGCVSMNRDIMNGPGYRRFFGGAGGSYRSSAPRLKIRINRMTGGILSLHCPGCSSSVRRGDSCTNDFCAFLGVPLGYPTPETGSARGRTLRWVYPRPQSGYHSAGSNMRGGRVGTQRGRGGYDTTGRPVPSGDRSTNR